jgi:hypothetical protein
MNPFQPKSKAEQNQIATYAWVREIKPHLKTLSDLKWYYRDCHQKILDYVECHYPEFTNFIPASAIELNKKLKMFCILDFIEYNLETENLFTQKISFEDNSEYVLKIEPSKFMRCYVQSHLQSDRSFIRQHTLFFSLAPSN